MKGGVWAAVKTLNKDTSDTGTSEHKPDAEKELMGIGTKLELVCKGHCALTVK